MGKVQVKSKSSHKSKRRDTNGTKKSEPENPSILLAQASEFLQTGIPEKALPLAQKAVQLSSSQEQYVLPSLSILAQIELEIGDIDSARTHFQQAVQLDPDGTEPDDRGGGAEKFLWLAQLSEEGGRDSIEWYERGGNILQRQIGELSNRIEDDAAEEAEEKRFKLASLLCSMIEVWMTDLSLEPEAESTCERLIAEALLLKDPPLPVALQELASIRLSQTRLEDAQSALRRSLEQWQELPPAHPSIPDFPTRIGLTRLLIEAEMLEEAHNVVEVLTAEDDQSVEAWYLLGWCRYLQGQEEQTDDAERKAYLLESRIWLRKCLVLYDQTEYEDDRLRDHALELVQGLDAQFGDEELEEDDEDAWEGFSDDEKEAEDHEMNGA